MSHESGSRSGLLEEVKDEEEWRKTTEGGRKRGWSVLSV